MQNEARHRAVFLAAALVICGGRSGADEFERSAYLDVTAPRLALVTSRGEPEPGVLQLELDPAAYRRLIDLGSAVVTRVPLPGRDAVDLELRSFSVVAQHARFVVVSAAGEQTAPVPPHRFLRGRVAGDTDSLAVVGLFEGRIAGFIRTGGATFGFGPREYDLARTGSHDLRIWTSETEERPAGVLCSLDTSTVPSATFHPPTVRGDVTSDTVLRASVAFDTTVEWFQRFGSVTATQNFTLNLLAQVSAIYESEFNVQLEVPYLRVFTAEPDPYTNGVTASSQLLAELRNEWNANQTGIDRTVAHLLTWSGTTTSVNGIAYLDVLCSHAQSPGNSFDYGVSALVGAGTTWETWLLAHELGHNFSSPHTHCYVPEIDQCANESGCYQGSIQQTVGTIMSYCNQVQNVFHPRVVDERLRPAAEAAYPSCIELAGEPGGLRSDQGDGLMVRRALACATETLRNDDGAYNSVLATSGTGQLAAIKRFTPGCYPFRLEQIDVIFGTSSSIAVGRPIRLLVYLDPEGTGTPEQAILVYTEDSTIQFLSNSEFNSYTLAAPVTVSSGDVYIGFYDLLADAQTTTLGIRDSSTSGDSFRATNSTSPESFVPVADATWMIRGAGGAVAAGSVLLEWGSPCNDVELPGQDFAVYLGLFDDFESYTSDTCSTAGARTHIVGGAPDDSFFIVVPVASNAEGSYGLTGEGAERAPATVACKPQQIGACP